MHISRTRTLVTVAMAVSLLSLSSCTDTPSKPAKAGASSEVTTAHPDETSGTAGHSASRQHAAAAPSDSQAEVVTTKDIKPVAIGDKVPDFEVTIAGKKWKLSELQQNKEMSEDGTLLLTFWCSFCHSCRHIERELDDLAQDYRGKAAVIAIDASAGETSQAVAEFARQKNLALPIALDAHGVSPRIFGTRVTTTTVVIDKHGVLRYRGQFGNHDHAYGRDALRAVLADEQVPVPETKHLG